MLLWGALFLMVLGIICLLLSYRLFIFSTSNEYNTIKRSVRNRKEYLTGGLKPELDGLDKVYIQGGMSDNDGKPISKGKLSDLFIEKFL